jgi:hypothetical protein
MTNTSDKIIDKLKLLLQKNLEKREAFEDIWLQTISEFDTWIKGLPCAISPLTRNLELFRRICVNFGDDNIRNNEFIQDVVLDGALSVGQSLEFCNNKYIVKNRKISARGGVLYCLENEHGEVIEKEFFD